MCFLDIVVESVATSLRIASLTITFHLLTTLFTRAVFTASIPQIIVRARRVCVSFSGDLQKYEQLRKIITRESYGPCQQHVLFWDIDHLLCFSCRIASGPTTTTTKRRRRDDNATTRRRRDDATTTPTPVSFSRGRGEEKFSKQFWIIPWSCTNMTWLCAAISSSM